MAHEPESWGFTPRRSELTEKLGPPLLKALNWAVASVIAIPIFLILFLPFLV